jgi:hypothetical protein
LISVQRAIPCGDLNSGDSSADGLRRSGGTLVQAL